MHNKSVLAPWSEQEIHVRAVNQTIMFIKSKGHNLENKKVGTIILMHDVSS